MRCFKRIVFVFLWSNLLLLGGVNGQSIIKGRVQDAATGEPLPGATIQIEGTYSGSITNGMGLFTLSAKSFPLVLSVRYIGYQSTQVAVDKMPSEPLRILLTASSIKLPEITISGEDPAISIMRRVIEEKQKWRKELRTYSVLAYNRFRMENDTGIVSIWESGTRAYWDANRGVREVSLWQQKTQNMNIDDLLPAAMFVANLYDDDIDVAGHRLMGVTHPNALSFYDFELTGFSSRDSLEVYLIAVKPKLKTSAGFVGNVAVLDQQYALLSAHLKPGAAFLFPPPINGVEIDYEQQFSSFGGNFWLPVDFKADMDVQIGFGGLLEFPVFRIRQLSSLSEFEVNVTLPDSLYAQRRSVVQDTSATKVTVRPLDGVGVPLTPEEAKAYAGIDSTMTLEKAYEPTGLLAKMVKTSVNTDGNGQNSRGNVRVGSSSSTSFRPNIWINRVEGYHLRLNAETWLGKQVSLQQSVGYSTAQKKVGWSLGGTWKAPIEVNVTYRDVISPQFQPQLRSQLFASYGVISGDEDYFDYFARKGFTLSAQKRLSRRNRIFATISFSSETHNPLVQKQFESFFGPKFEVRPNQQITQGDLQWVGVELKGERDSLPLPIGPQRDWKLEFEQSLGGTVTQLGNYSRLEGMVRWRIPTFFSRRLLPNALDIRVVGGRVWGDHIPNQKLGAIDGLTELSLFGGIKTLGTRPYVGDTWGLVAWEHTFRTVPFEIIGFDWAIKKHWNVLVHGAHGKTTNQSSSSVVKNSNGIHSELGVSLSGLFSLFRLDATWRVDEPGFRWGVSVARIY